MKSKTIIISSPHEDSNARGILTLYNEDEMLKCRMRLYSMPTLNNHCKIGIYHHDTVSSATLIERNGVYESSIVGEFNLDDDFYSAIVDTSNDNQVLLAGGTYAGFYFSDNSVFNEENNEVFDEVEEVDTQPIISCEENSDKCAVCKYKEYFYANSTPIIESNEEQEKENLDIIEDKEEAIEHPQENVEESKETLEKNENITTLISSIMPQFEYIFEHYELDEELNTLIPSAKFVKINENKEHYSIGAIYEGEELKIICYAVKCNYNEPAPSELGQHYQWLPVDKDDPLSIGYYIVFQDAKDLKIIEL